jgi:hypothetical protein
MTVYSLGIRRTTADSDKNRDVIWAHFIEKNIVRNKPFVKISMWMKGHIRLKLALRLPCYGRWLGWQIVKAYMREEKPTLQELMKNNNAQRIFMQSKYKGKG